MLKQRVLTALILVTVLALALLSTAQWVFPTLVLLFMVAGAWEWGRMNGSSQALSIWTACELFILIAFTWLLGWLNQSHTLLWIVASGVWVLVSVYLLKNGASAWLKIPQSLRRYLGVLALWLVWLAICQARMIGINFLMSALFLVCGLLILLPISQAERWVGNSHKINWHPVSVQVKVGKVYGVVSSEL